MSLMGAERPHMTEQEFFEKARAETGGWLKRDRVRRAVRFGEIRPTRVGHRSLYSDQDVIDFLRSLKVTA